ncbi:hypothetical protein [Streptomyces sp. NPDC050738]|uniref:hypothetical protein n=1 Tax=Streptomyces sp. NPDC050738 TaxID=3154744 RepID=UPI00341323A1
MIRNVLGSAVALIGAAAAVYSPFQAWYDGRHGSAYRIQDLFGGITTVKSSIAGSILLPFAFAALVALAGVVFRSRLLVAFAGVVTLGFAILWMVQMYQVESSLALSSDGSGLGQGVANAVGGGVCLLLGAALMSGRGSSRTQHAPVYAPEPEPASYPGPEPTYAQNEPSYTQNEAGDTATFSSRDLPPELTDPDPQPSADTQTQPQQWSPRKNG